MKKASLLVVTVAICVGAGLVWAEDKAEKKEPGKISVRKMEAQTVLYTIYRGPYDGVGKPIGELYALAGKNQIVPKGPLSLVYLNSPAYISPEHYLTEIRIPVGEEAGKLAGTLGAMTDVKSLRAHEVVAVEKAGGDRDYAGIYGRLYTWMAKNGYNPMDDAVEVFAEAGGRSYDQAKSEIMVPVVKAGEK